METEYTGHRRGGENNVLVGTATTLVSAEHWNARHDDEVKM